MIVEFDLGNSAGKWRLLDGSAVVARGAFEPPTIDLAALDGYRPRFARAVSVAGPDTEATLAAVLADRFGLQLQLVRVAGNAAGVTNSYDQPERMGADRWSAIVAAHHVAAGAKMVVDAGSALTVDLIDAAGCHRGGYIGVGLAMMRRALLEGTQRVRFGGDELTESIAPGKSTGDCVAAGTLLALRGSVAMALEEARSCFAGEPFRVLLCGGDAALLEPQLAAITGLGWEYRPDLVFEGLSYLCPADA